MKISLIIISRPVCQSTTQVLVCLGNKNVGLVDGRYTDSLEKEKKKKKKKKKVGVSLTSIQWHFDA